MECGFCKDLELKKDIVYKTNKWNVFLSQDQGYLGRCCIALNRHAGSLSKLKIDEWSDFFNIVKQLESTLKQAFGAEMFNWTCLMNNDYKAVPANPHVHWHFRPRYRNEVEFAGTSFKDPEFAHHYNRARQMIVPEEMKQKILEKLKENLQKE